jgi:solute carrier family 8 (sodium/calcium exchanger)
MRIRNPAKKYALYRYIKPTLFPFLFQIIEFFKQMDIAVASRSTLYTIQSVFVNPLVYSYWINMRNTLMDTLRRLGHAINVSGDGQFDSPGFMAAFCFYTFVETTSKKILDFYVAHKSMTEFSARMESLATKMLIKRLHKEGITVKVCTTDRSSQLKSLLKEINKAREEKGLPHIKHTFDVWHYVKAVVKDLWKASKLKRCQALGSWIRSVQRMLWFCFAECKGNPDLLREMILSIPLHVRGVHVFPENRLFKKCMHGDLPTDRDKPWLKEGSLSMKKLVLALRGPKDCRFKDLDYMTEFQHTGTNENINSLHNKYLSKRIYFPHPQNIVRACLTAIDHNTNVDRGAALNRDGEQIYHFKCSRDGEVWTAGEEKEAKDTSWRTKIMDNVLEVG